MDVANEMHREHQGFGLLLIGATAQLGSQPLKLCNNAIAFSRVRLAITFRTVVAARDRNIGKVPLRSSGAYRPYIVGPG